MTRFLIVRTILLFHLLLFPVAALAEGKWEQWRPTLSARTEVAAATLFDKLYIFGGFGEKGITNQVDVLDLKTGIWSVGFPMPEALHHMAAVTLNGKIYLVGGFRSGMWVPTDTLYEFDPTANRWTKKASMPTERGALGAGVVNGRIYAIGGAQRHIFQLKDVAANESYDPATDKWTTHAALPTPRDHFTVSVVDEKLYALGGRVDVDYNRNLNRNEVYDPITDQWTILTSMPTARSGITSQALNGKIHVFGGESGEGTFNQHEAYDPATGKWETKPPLPHAVHGLGSAVVDGKIHLLTGGPRPGGGGSQFHQVYSE